MKSLKIDVYKSIFLIIVGAFVFVYYLNSKKENYTIISINDGKRYVILNTKDGTQYLYRCNDFNKNDATLQSKSTLLKY
jgi:hypothetical protein